ncbi:TetR/AcrR family transcriptional regulator [Ancylobacter lacus]|uniref:TetR/AcrR family transcriptional regulator n=1 Tax=Ancylobacter lacus TaxID=2579970 RepID=UPI001BCBD8E0|nr:TetR/AcrR family transcriptional regulator [Ancylobacter lacus]MBS7540095.1 TetR family transcriptional regulator [Ancylobacter lacus]
MDNNTRSERTRAAVIQAALAIIARDGAGHLTLDAIARESGISKGGLMHQFRTKKAVLAALMEHQAAFFENYARDHIAAHGHQHAQPRLAAEIATLHAAVADPRSLALALLGAVAQEPELLGTTRMADREALEVIRAEAADPDLATLRWLAARGLTLSSLFGLSPLTDAERDHLFTLLADEARWTGQPGSDQAGGKQG